MSSFAPIALFVYNRPDHLEKTLAALARNELAEESDLYIFSDGPANSSDLVHVEKVRALLTEVTGFRSTHVKLQDTNVGLARSIIDGVNSVLEISDKVIVLEDDLVTSPFFLRFMNDALKQYAPASNVFSVSGFNFPPEILVVPGAVKGDVFFCSRNCSWGWGTWKDCWDQVDWEMSDFAEFAQDPVARKRFAKGGEDLFPMLHAQMNGLIDSWSIRFSYYHFRHDALAAWPLHSYVNNIGLDGSGTHSGQQLHPWVNDLSLASPKVSFPVDVRVDPVIQQRLRKIFQPSFKARLKNWLRRVCD